MQTKKTMDKYTLFIKELDNKELFLLKGMAASLKGTVRRDIYDYCRLNNFTQKKFNNLVSKLKKEGLGSDYTTQNFYFSHEEFMLDTEFQMEVLRIIAFETTAEIEKYHQFIKRVTDESSFGFSFKSVIHNLTQILRQMKTGDAQDLDLELPFGTTGHYLNRFFMVWTGWEEFYPLLDKLPPENRNYAMMRRMELVVEYLHPEPLAGLWKYLDFSKHQDKQLNFYRMYLAIPQFIYQRDNDGFLSYIASFTPDNLFISFVASFLRGEKESAIALYEEKLKEMGKNTNSRLRLSGILFFDFLYVCALYRINSESAVKKMQQILKSKQLRELDMHYKSIKLLLDLVFAPDPKKVLPEYRSVNRFSLSDFFHALVADHFGITDSLFFDVDMQKEAQAIGFSFFESTNATALLFPQKNEVSPWERTLDLLMGNSSTQKKGNACVSGSRIVYMLTKWGEIQPKLQKSKDGVTWTKGRNIALKTFREGIPEMAEADRQVAAMVKMVHEYNHYGYPTESYILEGVKAIQALAGNPLVFYEHAPEVSVEVAVHSPELSISKSKKGFEVSHNLLKEHLSELNYYFKDGNTRIRVVNLTKRQGEVIRMLSEIAVFPFDAKDKLVSVISALSKEITIHSDLIAESESAVRIKSDSTIVVQLIPISGGFRGEIFVKPLGSVAPYCKPGIGNDTVMGYIEGNAVQGIRDKKLEKENLKRITSAFYGEVELDTDERFEIDSPQRCLELLDLLFTLPYVKVEWPEGGRLNIRGRVDFNQLTLSVKRKGNWFELMGELNPDEESVLGLAAVLEQLHENPGSRFVSLGNDEYLALTEELRKRLNAMQNVTGASKKGVLKVSEFAAPLFNSWAEEGMNIKTDASYKRLIARIEQAASHTYEIPSRLQAALRPYQEDGFRWMARLCDWGAGACLADDMGLGKTIQTIAMLLHRAPTGASMVIAPASVLLNWEQEIARFAPALTTKVMHGTAERDNLISGLEPFDVVLTTYGLLATETERLCGHSWNMIVLDEAHTIKNKETKMSKAAMKLEGEFRLLLTGTPVQNHLGEIWNLFQFMNPGMLGSFEQFSSRFMSENKEQRELLKKLVSPFLLRRTKSEVLSDLPGKTEIVIPVELSSEERVVYESIRRKAEELLSEESTNTIQTLAEITRLRQAASHIGMVGKASDAQSSKMNAFFELLEEMKENNHRALVFSQFTSHLAFFKEALDKRGIPYLYLDGSTPVPERAKLVKSFQTGEQPLFLISLKAGGLGLNLTAADFIIHLDPWWNPAIEDQASDRAYRIGQKRPVTVYRLIATNTIEEKIIELHHAKKDMADSLLEGSNRMLGHDELLALLK